MTNVKCTFSHDENEIIFEFPWAWWISTIFHRWPRWMHFSLSLKPDDFRSSPTIMNSNNISSSTNVRCTFPLHQNEIILELLSPRVISAIFHHRATPDVLLPAAKWDHRRIYVTMINLNYISALTNIRWTFCGHENEIIVEFPAAWWSSTIFHRWPRSSVLFVFIKMWLF